MNKYYADEDINNPQHPEYDYTVATKKATPKLRYLVMIVVRGERADQFGKIFDDLHAWFNCHNTDPRCSSVRVHIDHSEPYDSRLEIDLVFDARLEDLDPACEQYASGDIEISLFLDNDGCPGEKIMEFNQLGTRA